MQKKVRVKNRRKGQPFEQHLFKCMECGNLYSLFRPKGFLREQKHIKSLWCYKCKRRMKFIELGNFEEE